MERVGANELSGQAWSGDYFRRTLKRDLRGHGEDFDPFALHGRDALKFGDFDRRSVAERDMWAEEVIVGGEKHN